MKLQDLLSKFFLFFLLVSANVIAETKWEVATVFLGAQEDEVFQGDVDENILELARVVPSSALNLSLYRELPEKTYSYYPQAPSLKEAKLDELLSVKKFGPIKVPGKYNKTSRSKLVTFLKTAFADPKAKKALVLYGHGMGPMGLRDLPTVELKALLKKLKIKFDVIWYDACFLASIEFLHELRQFSHYTVASQEAEFTSGLTFESLNELSKFDNGKDAALFLAKQFIESYSYMKNGKQRNYVSVSSATITVLDNSHLNGLVSGLQDISAAIKALPEDSRNHLKKRLENLFKMDRAELVDLGHLLIEFRKMNKETFLDQKLTHLIRRLNIESVKKLKTNARVRIPVPQTNALMVYGFNDWKNGFEAEYNDNPAYAEIIKSIGFVEGPFGQKWPSKKFSGKSTQVSPFAPGVDSFHYYFVDAKGKSLGAWASAHRTHDIVEDSGDFLIYNAYTQRVGTKAERYTGLNISNVMTIPSIDYFELEFNQRVKWLDL